MEKSICDERHRQINYRLNVAEKRLDICEERLDRNELVSTRLEERLNNLISQLEQLNKTIKWFMGLLLGGIISFFFYAIQNGILK